MVDILNETEAAQQMIEQLEANQAAKAARHAKQAQEVVEAEGHAQEVAAHIASGEVASAKVSEEVRTAPEFDPAEEAAAGARMIDELLAGQQAREAKHASVMEALDQDVLDEVAAAGKVIESVKGNN